MGISVADYVQAVGGRFLVSLILALAFRGPSGRTSPLPPTLAPVASYLLSSGWSSWAQRLCVSSASSGGASGTVGLRRRRRRFAKVTYEALRCDANPDGTVTDREPPGCIACLDRRDHRVGVGVDPRDRSVARVRDPD